MSNQIPVGKILKELQNKIQAAYGDKTKVKVTGVLVDLAGHDGKSHQIVLKSLTGGRKDGNKDK